MYDFPGNMIGSCLQQQTSICPFGKVGSGYFNGVVIRLHSVPRNPKTEMLSFTLLYSVF